MQDTKCEKCGAAIQIWEKADIIKCKECGAKYKMSSSILEEDQMNFEFDFSGFICMHNGVSGPCGSECPAPDMYCRDHTTDESFKNAKNAIVYAEKRVVEVKSVLEKMEESKKTWLIQEVSGINGQNNFVRKDQDWKN